MWLLILVVFVFPLGGIGRVVNGAFMVLKGHRSIVNQVRFNPHTYMICSSGVEKIIKVRLVVRKHVLVLIQKEVFCFAQILQIILFLTPSVFSLCSFLRWCVSFAWLRTTFEFVNTKAVLLWSGFQLLLPVFYKSWFFSLILLIIACLLNLVYSDTEICFQTYLWFIYVNV